MEKATLKVFWLYLQNAKLNAIVNMHHDGADSKYWLSIKEAASDEERNEAIKNQPDEESYTLSKVYGEDPR